jgi:hypothetical protein
MGTALESQGLTSVRLSGSTVIWLLLRKYAAASLVAALGAALAQGFGWLPSMAAGLCLFYAIESRLAFALPLALQGSQKPLADSWALCRLRQPWGEGTLMVLLIASRMILGTLTRGNARAWLTGCGAMVAWYAELRPWGWP